MKFIVNCIKPILIILQTNYYLSVTLLITMAVSVIFGHDMLFQADVDLYGPLANNLRIVLIYLALIEITITMFSMIRKEYYLVFFLGSFFIILTGLIDFYAEVNHILLETDYRLFFTYIGLSHMAYGAFTQIKTKPEE